MVPCFVNRSAFLLRIVKPASLPARIEGGRQWRETFRSVDQTRLSGPRNILAGLSTDVPGSSAKCERFTKPALVGKRSVRVRSVSSPDTNHKIGGTLNCEKVMPVYHYITRGRLY
jgi:hypothetical protein